MNVQQLRLSYRKKSMLLDNISRNSDTISPEIQFEYSWSYCDTAKWQLKLMQLNLTLNPKSRHQAYISNLQISNPFCQTTQHIFIRKNMTLYYMADSIAVWPLHRSRGEEQIRSCREQEREGRSEVGTSCVRIARQQRSHRAKERLQSRRGEVVEEKRRDHRSQNPWRLKRLKTIIINSQKTRAFLSFQDKKQGHIWLFRSSFGHVFYVIPPDSAAKHSAMAEHILSATAFCAALDLQLCRTLPWLRLPPLLLTTEIWLYTLDCDASWLRQYNTTMTWTWYGSCTVIVSFVNGKR